MKRSLFAGALVLLAIVFATLGVWQLERRAWKLDLIARVEARLRAPPGPLPDSAAEHDAYTRVRVRGVFLHDRETLVQALTERGAGWWVMTPLRTDTGRVVLVNRGFVPPGRRDPASRAAGAPSGSVTVTGLLRLTEPRGGFLRRNDPAAGRWYSRDVAAIAAARGVGPAAPVFIDADASPNPGGYPVGGMTVVRFRNSHLVYALTWFGLAILSLAGLALVVRSGRPQALFAPDH
ncbi:SURF1 family protein [Phenylobacterium sp. VNQ135]|uniref:SURF1 family protein n=1 Tax=Phenylobacterium sp. VNQ135 TaxID=3400922 RepID=UPI003C054BC5